MTQIEAAALIGILINGFPNARFTEENATMYERAIADLGAAETQRAVEELIRTSNRLPLVADIRGEVMRARREATQRAEAERARRPLLGTPGAVQVGPSAAAWASALPAHLAASERHQRMATAWYAKHRKPLPPDPGLEFVNVCRAGARGEDVRERARKVVGIPSDADEYERRYP